MLLILLAVLAVAFANGANDNFKGVATLRGSRTAGYAVCLAWATFATLAGSLASVFLADRLVAAFSGAGLVPAAVAADPQFLLAAAAGAAGALLVATAAGLPVSTTHALMGALVGAGLVFARGGIAWTTLGEKFALPLLLSPLAAALLTVLLYVPLRAARRALGVTAQSCVCVGQKVVATCGSPAEAAAYVETQLTTGTEACCVERYHGAVVGVSAQQALDTAHFLTSGAMSFARGLNDTPKIVALLAAAHVLGLRTGLAAVSLAIAAGGLLAARRVARTVSEKVAEMNTGQGFTASLVTASLVSAATWFGLPVSTTHVSCGSLFGIGAVNRTARWKMIGAILLAWVTTLPVAALLSASVAGLLKP